MIGLFGRGKRKGQRAPDGRSKAGGGRERDRSGDRAGTRQRGESAPKVRSGAEVLVDRMDGGARRWRRTAILAALVLLVPAGIGVAATLAPQDSAALIYEVGAEVAELSAAAGLAVDAVTVEGRERTDVEDLRDAIGVNRGDPIVFLDLEGVRQRVKALPWVKKVAVERRLPDALHVRLEERAPFVRWQNGGRTVLIDREGVVLAQAIGTEHRSLRRLVGPGAPQKAVVLFEILESDAVLFERVTTATRVRDRRWDVTFDNGVVVRLPEEGARQAWQRFSRLQAAERLLERDVRAIDLRVSDRVILELTPEAVQSRTLPGKNT